MAPRQSQVRLTGENDLTLGLRREGDRLRRGTGADEQRLKIAPFAVGKQDGVAGFRRLDRRVALPIAAVMGAQLLFVGPSRITKSLQQSWCKLGQPFARLSRLRRAIPTTMPVTYHTANVARTLKTKARERLQRVGIVHVACKNEIPNTRRQLRCRFKQCRVVPLHIVQCRPKLL